MVERTALLALTDGLLQPERFKDYCPNGLQVEGRPHVQSVASGVTASLAFIQSAIDAGADTLLVHHGLFWRNQTGAVTGWLKKRLALLLQHDINLLAYHLPLDAHPALGNNAQLRIWAFGLTARLVSKVWVLWGKRQSLLKTAKPWRSFCKAVWASNPCLWCLTPKGLFGAWLGVRAAHKTCLKRPSPKASMLSSLVKSPNPKRIWRMRQA
jgi:putative NIF3 family GTP cyclohydrolase 1 type 2